MDTLLTAVLAFASTNIDDLFILAIFFGDKRFSIRDICLGQYLGIGSLVVISYLGASMGRWVDVRYIGLLGFFPIYLGIRQLIELFNASSPEDKSQWNERQNLSTGFLAVASITFANGGDNIGTYIPLFSTLNNADLSILLFVFILMVAFWLASALYLSQRPLLAKTIERYGHIITPIVLCFLGIYILYENSSFTLLT